MAFIGKGFEQAIFRDISNTNPSNVATGFTGLVNRSGQLYYRQASTGIEQVVSGNTFDPNGDVPTVIGTIQTYSSRSVIPSFAVTDIAQGAGGYMACSTGTNALYWSRDSYSWSQVGTTPFAIIRGVQWVAGKWVALGNTQTSYSSDNGATWSSAVTLPGTPGGGIPNRLYSVNNVLFVLSSGNYIASSVDGITFSLQTLPTNASTTFKAIAWNGSVYCAVGGVPGTTTSVATCSVATGNGTWTAQTVAAFSNRSLNGVAFGGTFLTAVGESGSIICSTNNGVTLTNPVSGTSNELYAIIAFSGFFQTWEISVNSLYTTFASANTSWFAGASFSGTFGMVRPMSKFVAFYDQSTASVVNFSKTFPGIAFGDRQSGIALSDPGEITAFNGGNAIARFGSTGAMVKGQTASAKITSIITAGSGFVGETLEASGGTLGSTTIDSSTANTSICGVTLTPGIWEVQGGYYVVAGATTAWTQAAWGISSTNNGIDSLTKGGWSQMSGFQSLCPINQAFLSTTGTRRFNVTSNTPVYLVSTITYSVLGGATYSSSNYIKAVRIA